MKPMHQAYLNKGKSTCVSAKIVEKIG